MKKVKTAWVLAAALLLLAPTSVLAQAQESVSKDFPDDQDANTNNVADDSNPDVDGSLRFRLALKKGMTNVNTAPNYVINLVGGESGAEVAALGVEAICRAAVQDWGYGCQGTVTDPSLVLCNGGLDQAPAALNDDCCDLVTPTAEVNLYCYDGAIAFGKRFKILRTPGPTEKFEITGSRLDVDPDALEHRTTAGNTVETDILPQYCVRVDRGSPAVDGTLNFSVTGGSSAGSFSVNSTGLSDEALHGAIANGFRSLPNGGLTAVLLPNAAAKCKFADAYQGPTVFLPNVHAKNVTKVGARGVQGQLVAAETSSQGGNIPTLSEWGLIFLAGILAVSALWMLRRRSQTGSPA